MFNRSLDTLVGIAVALVMGRLLWPKTVWPECRSCINNWSPPCTNDWRAAPRSGVKALHLRRSTRKPSPGSFWNYNAWSTLKTTWERQARTLKRLRWPQRMSLWRCLQVRWLLVERLIQRSIRSLANPLPELSHYLSNHLNEPGAPAEELRLGSSGSALPLPQRIALEEQVTRFRRLLRSQQLFNRVHP